MERQTVSREEYLRIMNEKLSNHHGWQEVQDKAEVELEFKDIMPNLKNSYGVTMPSEKEHKERAEQIYEEVLAEICQQYEFHADDGKGEDEETDTSVTG
jgi:hypothetical protein